MAAYLCGFIYARMRAALSTRGGGCVTMSPFGV